MSMAKRKKFTIKLRSGDLILGERTLVMGVLNVTPDSFSDGGNFLAKERAIEHALQMERDGADLIDVGAESTRPGAEAVSVEEELRRLVPVLEGLKGKLQIPISIDTQKAEVAEAALEFGAQIINDISGLKNDARIADAAVRYGVPLLLMHMRGAPRTMQKAGFARNVLIDVKRGLRESIEIARKAGVKKSQILVDPGIGFGKSYAQNYELLQKLPEIAALGYPLVVGTSRKGFIGATLAKDAKRPLRVEERIWGTAAPWGRAFWAVRISFACTMCGRWCKWRG